MSETSTPAPAGELHVMQRLKAGMVKGRLVVGEQWMIVIFASETAMQQFVHESGCKLIEENEDGNDAQG